MDISKIKQPLNQFVQKIPKSVKVDKVIIFGSYLEGNATEDSDVDVIVVSDDFRKMDEDQRLDILYDAADDIDPEVHPWAFTNEELNQKSKLTTWGYARTSGFRFI